MQHNTRRPKKTADIFDTSAAFAAFISVNRIPVRRRKINGHTIQYKYCEMSMTINKIALNNKR